MQPISVTASDNAFLIAVNRGLRHGGACVFGGESQVQTSARAYRFVAARVFGTMVRKYGDVASVPGHSGLHTKGRVDINSRLALLNLTRLAVFDDDAAQDEKSGEQDVIVIDEEEEGDDGGEEEVLSELGVGKGAGKREMGAGVGELEASEDGGEVEGGNLEVGGEGGKDGVDGSKDDASPPVAAEQRKDKTATQILEIYFKLNKFRCTMTGCAGTTVASLRCLNDS